MGVPGRRVGGRPPEVAAEPDESAWPSQGAGSGRSGLGERVVLFDEAGYRTLSLAAVEDNDLLRPA